MNPHCRLPQETAGHRVEAEHVASLPRADGDQTGTVHGAPYGNEHGLHLITVVEVMGESLVVPQKLSGPFADNATIESV